MRHRRAMVVAVCALGAAVAAPVASGAGRASHTPKRVTKQVQVNDDFFSRTKVTITKGSSVKWVWGSEDYNTHNVTLIRGPKGVRTRRFTSRDGARGYRFTRTFTTPGTYHFECTIHPFMLITVTVKR